MCDDDCKGLQCLEPHLLPPASVPADRFASSQVPRPTRNLRRGGTVHRKQRQVEVGEARDTVTGLNIGATDLEGTMNVLFHYDIIIMFNYSLLYGRDVTVLHCTCQKDDHWLENCNC